MNDFGPSSVDGWLAKIIGQELGVNITEKQGRMLVTVLFTDIVNSTEHALKLGDKRWRELLERHHKLFRKELTNFHGHEVDTAGDGFFAIFERPVYAIHCASAASDAPVAISVSLTNLKKRSKNMGCPINKTKIVCTVGPAPWSGRS